jgi:hypothetical protein
MPAFCQSTKGVLEVPCEQLCLPGSAAHKLRSTGLGCRLLLRGRGRRQSTPSDSAQYLVVVPSTLSSCPVPCRRAQHLVVVPSTSSSCPAPCRRAQHLVVVPSTLSSCPGPCRRAQHLVVVFLYCYRMKP